VNNTTNTSTANSATFTTMFGSVHEDPVIQGMLNHVTAQQARHRKRVEKSRNVTGVEIGQVWKRRRGTDQGTIVAIEDSARGKYVRLQYDYNGWRWWQRADCFVNAFRPTGETRKVDHHKCKVIK
jgi:hypothetical protein